MSKDKFQEKNGQTEIKIGEKLFKTTEATATVIENIVSFFNDGEGLIKLTQSHGINTMKNTLLGVTNGRTPTKYTLSIDNFDNRITAINTNAKSNYRSEFTIERFEEIKFHLKSDKINKFLDVIFCFMDKNPRITFPIEAYMEYVGRQITVNSKKDTIKELKKLCEIITNFKLSLVERNKYFSYKRPFSGAEYKKGYIKITLDVDFVNMIDKQFFVLPKEVGTLKNSAYFMACFIFLQARISKKYDLTLKNETLFDYSGLPRYEEVREGKRQITQRIIEPYSQALYQITEILKGHIEVKEEEFEPNNWEAFKNAKIHIQLPTIKKTIESIKIKRKKKIKQVINNSNRKKKSE